MKKIMAILLVLVMATSLAACGEKTVTIYVQTQSLRTIGDVEIRMEYGYSDDGTPLSVMTYFDDQLYQTTTTRISKGVQYVTTTDSEGNSSVQSMESLYDDKGQLIQMSTWYGVTEAAKTRYSYDDQGNIVKAVTTSGEETITTTYTYDENGNLVTQLQVNEQDGTYLRRESEYNENAFVIRESNYSGEDVLEGYVEITYGQENTEKTMTYYDGEGNPTGEVVVETYDENGNKVKEVTIVDGEVTMTIVNTYVAMEVPVKD